MTDRFEVVDIVEQDAVAVLYKALDRETGEHVALRRVGGEKELAFVKTGEEGKQAFQETVDLLVGAEGAGIRKVIAGGVDEVDGAPWVAYEWFEGKSFVHEPAFAIASMDLREEAMEAVLKCLVVLHGADLLGGWIGFENLFLKEDGQWTVELCPERMAIAKVGGIEVDHPFASSLLEAAGKGSEPTDLRGAAEFFAMLKKGTTDSQKTALPSNWIRFFGWMKKDEGVNAAEALQRLQKIRNPDVLEGMSAIRRKNRAITSYVKPSVDPNQVVTPPISATPPPGSSSGQGALLTSTTGHVTQAIPTSSGPLIGGASATVPLSTTAKKSKLPLILGLAACVVFAVLAILVVKKSSQFSGKTTADELNSDSQKKRVSEAERIRLRKESLARGDKIIINNENAPSAEEKEDPKPRKKPKKKKGKKKKNAQ